VLASRASRPATPSRPAIAKKRDGQALAPGELRFLIDGFVAGEVADYQMTAFAMAALLRGTTAAETAALTLAMRDSGRSLRLGRTPVPKLDKHDRRRGR
jgi:pyrimidine-nucleoside phosphorylase